jgi:hypothetical protein
MKVSDTDQIHRFAKNGKSPVALFFHRDGTRSFRDGQGRWIRHLATVSPQIINQLDRHTRVRLWVRDFQVERAWAQAHA